MFRFFGISILKFRNSEAFYFTINPCIEIAEISMARIRKYLSLRKELPLSRFNQQKGEKHYVGLENSEARLNTHVCRRVLNSARNDLRSIVARSSH